MGRRRAATVALLLALGALLYGPWLALPPFHGEESRRALPAREMLASGDWVLPTIWGRAYLHKPPGHFWLVAGCARLTGAGWGGCIVALVSDDVVSEFAAEVPRRYFEQTGLRADVFPCRAGGGAGHVADL